jgi:hypothetical protein
MPGEVRLEVRPVGSADGASARQVDALERTAHLERLGWADR